MTVIPSSVLFFFNHFILCWRTLNATETCLRTIRRWQTKSVQEMNYENLKTWLGLYVLEVEVKGKAQETVWKHFFCCLDEFRGPTGTRIKLNWYQLLL